MKITLNNNIEIKVPVSKETEVKDIVTSILFEEQKPKTVRKKKAENGYRPWTATDIELLREQYGKGKISDIAKVLGRTKGSV